MFWLLAIVLGVVQVWAAATSHSMNEDGVNYLDMGDAFLRGDLSMAINSVWSPLYSLLLGVVISISDPPMRWEFATVHLVNFFVYLGAMACFAFFWSQVMRGRPVEGSDSDSITMPTWAWLAIGYTLFIWSSLGLIGIWTVTPDMLVAALVYLIAGLILRIHSEGIAWRKFILLGVLLGLGYLAKAVMLPLGLVFLGVTALAVGNLRQAIPRVFVALVAFLLVAGPFVGAISMAKGHLTFGDAGKLTYARYVNGIPYPHWQGEVPGGGTPVHPSRKILAEPPIYEFGGPVGGTYPISYDPSYWYEGVAMRLDLREQLTALLPSASFYADLFVHQQGGLLVGVLVLYLIGRRPPLRLRETAPQWSLIVPALAAFGMYALVYVESRYLAPFVVLFWAGLLAGIRLPNSGEYRRLVTAVSAAILLFMLAGVGALHLQGLDRLAAKAQASGMSSQQTASPSWPGEVAEELHDLGIQPGDKVGVIGYGFQSFWARLARVQIVAEMFGWEADAYWLGDEPARAAVISAFTRSGARAIVAEDVPSYASLEGWHQIKSTNYYAYLLETDGSQASR